MSSVSKAFFFLPFVLCNASISGHSYDLNRAGTDHKVHVMDYAPTVFHFIREACGVSSSAYLLAWSTNEIKTSQVDGSDLVYSSDKKFVAKALTEHDRDVCLEMLPKYYDYVRSNPHSLLVKVFGLISVSRGKKMVCYMVIENIFNHRIPLHYMFHLSGNQTNTASDKGGNGVLSRLTMRRRSSSGSKAQLAMPRSGFGSLQRNRSSSLILDPPAFSKDKHGHSKVTAYGNDQIWKNQGRTVLVEKLVMPQLSEQMAKDLDFLKDAGITDHKLVIGVHEGEPVVPPSPDAELKRLVKIPSMVVFQNNSPVKTPSSSKKAAAGSSVATEISPVDFSNLRRTKRVSVQSVDQEQSIPGSPFRSFKGGLYSRTKDREELYFIGIVDIFGVNQKDKKRSEKAKAKNSCLKEWIKENFESYDPLPKDSKQTATLRPRQNKPQHEKEDGNNNNSNSNN